jgi:hypothetical protein
LLEALRGLDEPQRDSLDESHADLATKRLGLSRSVEAEIARLDRLTRKGGTVPGQEFAALVRLVGRRPDATLVFSEAGRRAARHAVARLPSSASMLARVAPGRARAALGFRLARRIVRDTLGSTLDQREGMPQAVLGGALSVVTEPGPACSFVGSALGEVLRRLVDFDGAMIHVSCRSRGAHECTWSAAAATGSERSA